MDSFLYPNCCIDAETFLLEQDSAHGGHESDSICFAAGCMADSG